MNWFRVLPYSKNEVKILLAKIDSIIDGCSSMQPSRASAWGSMPSKAM
jgi:hypothetical protein